MREVKKAGKERGSHFFSNLSFVPSRESHYAGHSEDEVRADDV